MDSDFQFHPWIHLLSQCYFSIIDDTENVEQSLIIMRHVQESWKSNLKGGREEKIICCNKTFTQWFEIVGCVWAWQGAIAQSPSAWECHKEMETRSFSAVTSLRKLSEFQDNAACNKFKIFTKLLFKPACGQWNGTKCMFLFQFFFFFLTGFASGLPLEPPHLSGKRRISLMTDVKLQPAESFLK